MRTQEEIDNGVFYTAQERRTNALLDLLSERTKRADDALEYLSWAKMTSLKDDSLAMIEHLERILRGE